MFLESGPAPSLGLLHILEDTLSLIRGDELNAERRQYVLRQSKAFLQEVKEVSEATNQQQRRFPGPTRWRALERFALASRYLAENQSRLDPSSLAVVEEAVDKLEAGERLPAVSPAVVTLTSLCERMSRDLSKGIIDAVEEEKRLGV